MRVATRQRSGSTLDVEPVGSAGLDLNTNPALLEPNKLRTAQNVAAGQEGLERRKGSVKVTRFADPTRAYGAKVLGATDGQYAFFTPPLFPRGSWAIRLHFSAIRPGTGSVYALSSWVSHAQHFVNGVVWATLSALGLCTVSVSWEGGGTSSISTTLAAGAHKHLLLVFNAIAGTLTLYVDGDAAGTPIGGIASTAQLRQDPSVKWYLGISYDPGVGVDAGTGMNAVVGPVIGFTFRSMDITAGPAPLLAELRAGIFQDWPNPASRSILFHYSMRESSAGAAIQMIDASKFKNHGTYVGTPSTATALVWAAQNGNYIGNVRKAALGALSDASVNLVALGGVLHYETIESGV